MTTVESYRSRILKVLLHIENHLDEELGLNELAQVACFSPYHFHRIFRGITGEPVKEYVRRLRMQRAASRLKYGTQPVTDIALDSGYESHEAFTRSFRAIFDESPSGFRRSRAQSAGAPPEIEVHIERTPAMRVAFVRHAGPYQTVGDAWTTLMSWAGRRGLFGASTRYFGILHDDPEVTQPDKLRYDAAITLGREVDPPPQVGVKDLAPAEYAVTRHKGPYERLHEAYERLCGEWLPVSGYELDSAPSLEFYRNMPQSTAPEELLTDIYLPLAAR